MVHVMKLKNEPFQKIKSGQKPDRYQPVFRVWTEPKRRKPDKSGPPWVTDYLEFFFCVSASCSRMIPRLTSSLK